jgi:hypothetical protein
LSAKVFLVALLTLLAAPDVDLAGHWTLRLDPGFDGSAASVGCDITQDGPALVVECEQFSAGEGTLDANVVKFVIMTGPNNLLPARFSGTLDSSGRLLTGTWRLEDTTGNRIGRFRAEKQ